MARAQAPRHVPAPYRKLLFLLRVLQAIGYVAFTTVATPLVVSLVAPEERARRLAVFGAAANVAISLTPAAITALLQVGSVETGLAASGVFALAGGLLAVLLPARATRTSGGGAGSAGGRGEASAGTGKRSRLRTRRGAGSAIPGAALAGAPASSYPASKTCPAAN